MRYLLFAGQNYYPGGGAHDCVGAYEYSYEPSAIEWAERFDVDTAEWSWDHAEWKHLARIDATGLTIVRAWDRDYDLVPMGSSGHRRVMRPWELDDRSIG
jgi:hypothetical protein